ncbi:MAG: metallophosphoesterase [Wenzhouxiangellaceae bacterium]
MKPAAHAGRMDSRTGGFRLVQVSDCHLAVDPDAAYRGMNADANLARLTPAVNAFDPDALLLTGDLSEDASLDSYQRLAEWASRFDVTVGWLPGNHDDPDRMRPIFDAAGFTDGPCLSAGGWTLVLLDSRWPDDPAGELDDERLRPLDDIQPDTPSGVFVHHQPVPVGARWIDRVGMRESGRLWNRLRAGPRPRFIAFGHVHQRFRCRIQGVDVLACPATAANSRPGTERFTPGEITPMARWFVLQPDHYRTGYLTP